MSRYVRTARGYARVEGEELAILNAAPWLGGTETRRVKDDGERLVPAEPSKVICVGRNYAAHAVELGNEVPKEPLLFFKPPSALLSPGETIVRPKESERVEHEGEVAIVIGKRARRVDIGEAAECIFGITCGNDVTARDIQRGDKLFTRGKGFDTFCPLGPEIHRYDPNSDYEIRTSVNGEERQHGKLSQMMFPLPFLVSYISQVMTLEVGDVILTGTPSGVGPLLDGDRVRVEIGGLPALENPVEDELR